MAALDPTAPPELDENATGTSVPRATLKIIRQSGDLGDDDDEDDDEYMRGLLGDSDSDSEDEDDEEANGGPSDPSKSKKARKEAALKQLMESIDTADSDEEMEDGPNDVDGKAAKKGKAKATDDDEDDEEEDSEDDDEDIEVEEFVLCTLDPEKASCFIHKCLYIQLTYFQNYQQPLDITIAENERVFFKVTGTHTIYLTGNYVIPDDDGHNHHHEIYDSDSDEEDDEEYDLSPDEDELELEMDDEESDELDDLENPRVTELDSDEEVPKLVKGDEKKGKNKRSADELDEGASLDDIMANSLKSDAADADPKLTKKQLKKLKKNNGDAAPVKAGEEKNGEAKTDKADKKVQFAKNLEQGPTGSQEKAKAAEGTAPVKANGEKPKAALGVKVVQGVKIDDKKLGSGPAAKKGDRVGMRYIGKLTNGQVFDCKLSCGFQVSTLANYTIANKKGKPFSFKLGSGEVIKGWDIGVAGIQVGGERRLNIPAHLAYGSKGQPGIPANSELVFDIKCLEIKK
jgi:FK506-binding nuclear protein